MLDVEGVDIDIEPSLFEIAIENDDYEMMKILFNHPTQIKHKDYILELSKVDNNRCRFRTWIDQKSVNFLCAMLTSPRITLIE